MWTFFPNRYFKRCQKGTFLCSNMSGGKEPVFLVLKVMIAALLEILYLGTLSLPKLWNFRQIFQQVMVWSSQLDTRQCPRMLCPLPEVEICQNSGSGRSNPQSLGEGAQLASLERSSLPSLTGACWPSGCGLSLSRSRLDAMRRLECHDGGTVLNHSACYSFSKSLMLFLYNWWYTLSNDRKQVTAMAVWQSDWQLFRIAFQLLGTEPSGTEGNIPYLLT